MRYNDTIVPKRSPEKETMEFNRLFPVGTVVRFWPRLRQGYGKIGTLAHPATVLSGHTAVAWIKDWPGCVALTHVEPLPTAKGEKP